jgi:hypothetical protein
MSVRNRADEMRKTPQTVGLVFPLVFALGSWVACAEERPPVRAQKGSVSIGGNVTGSTITIGMTPEQVQELTKAAAAGATGPLADRIIDLSKKLGVTQDAALSLLRIVGERDVPLEQLPQKLAEVARSVSKVPGPACRTRSAEPVSAKSRRASPSRGQGWQLPQSP